MGLVLKTGPACYFRGFCATLVVRAYNSMDARHASGGDDEAWKQGNNQKRSAVSDTRVQHASRTQPRGS
jgi:hypothetical protein